MSPDRESRRGTGHGRDEAALEAFGESLRSALSTRAAAIEVEPDPMDLAGRIAASGRSAARKGQLMVAAAAVVLAGAVGGAAGILFSPPTPQHTLFSSRTGHEGGPLPTGPSTHGRRKAGAGNVYAHSQPAVDIVRTTADGAALQATGHWLDAFALSNLASGSGCYGAQLVVTTATAGRTTTGGTGVVGVQPLSPSGLEVVSSGSAPAANGQDVWWATVAVGTEVARVAAESPSGGKDATRPTGGVTVIGGLVPADEQSHFFSVVAETGAGEGLSSMGFKLGWGSKMVEAGASTAPTLGAGSCVAQLPEQVVLNSSGSQPSAPLLAASSVVSAFNQAYAPAELAPRDQLAAVRQGSDLLAGLPASVGSARSARSSRSEVVQVAEVAFLSVSQAEVAYRVGSSRWRSGLAILGPGGLWQVSETTFCSDVSDGLALALPSPIASGCQRVLETG